MKKILTWAKANPYKIAVTLFAIILFMLLMAQCNKTNTLNKKLTTSEQNVKALNDSVRQTQTKDNKPEFDKLALLTDKVSNLEKLSTDLAEEVRNTKGKTTYITKVGASIKHDTTYLPAKTTVTDSMITTNFSKDTVYSQGNSRYLAGYTTYDIKSGESLAAVTKDSLNLSLITGIKNLDKGKPEIFVRSPYPGFTPTSIEGAILDPSLFKPKNKQRLITIGLNIGYTPITYSLSKGLRLDPAQFGASIGANINLSRLLNK